MGDFILLPNFLIIFSAYSFSCLWCGIVMSRAMSLGWTAVNALSGRMGPVVCRYL